MSSELNFPKLNGEAEAFLITSKALVKQYEELGKLGLKQKNLFAKDDLKTFSKLTEDVKRLEQALKQKEKAQKDVLTVEKQQLKVKKELEQSLKKEDALRKKAVKDLSLENKAKRDLINTQITENRLTIQQRKERERLEAQRKKALIASKKEAEQLKKKKATLLASTTAYKKLTTATNKAQLEFKELASEFGVTSKQAQKALLRFNKLDKSLRTINNTARDGRRDVGRYGIATQGLGKSLLSLGGSLVGGLGIATGVQLFTQVVGESFQVVRSFSSAQSELAGVLGTTAVKITDLTELSKELGSTTAFTATEVTKAQIELAKLGFTNNDIKASLSGVLDGATALGVGIPETAALVASSLKAFGLEASETDRVVSTLAVSTTKTSLDFAKLQTALGNVAPAASAFGASIEETTALLGLITDKGIDASTAGSQLRNIFIKLKSEGLTLDEALERIANSQDSVTEANQLFGKQGVTTALALAEQRDKIDGLTESITGQDEALKNLVEERLNNLDGDLKILSSTWEGLILSFEDGSGVLNSIFRGLVQFATIILNAFTTTNKVLSKFFGTLAKEFAPAIDAIKELFGGFGDFNIKGAITELIISRLVIGFKAVILPIRLAFQNILLLKDAFSVAVNAGKKLLNLLGADFDVVDIDVNKITDRFKKIGDIIVDTFTVGDIEDEQKKNADKVLKNELDRINKLSKAKKDALDKNNKDSESSLIKEEETIGAINKQRELVSKLQKERSEASEDQIAEKTKELELAQKELARLEAIGKQIKINQELRTNQDLFNESSENRNEFLKERELSLRSQGKTEEEIQEDLSKLKIDIKEAEVEQLKLLGLESLDAEVELARLKDKQRADELKKEQAHRKQLSDLANQALDEFIRISNERSEKKQSEIEDSIEGSQEEQDDLRRIVENTTGQAQLNAIEALEEEKAIEQRRTEELKKEKEKQVNIEAFLTALKLASTQAGQPNAIPKTIGDISALATGVLKVIPAFKDGVIDFEGGKAIVGDGGVPEVVATPDGQTFLTPSTDTLVDLPKGTDVYSSVAEFNKQMPQLKPHELKESSVNLDLLNAMNSVNNSIRKIKIPEVSFDYDIVTGIAEKKVRKGNRIERMKKRY